jgi:hypothetical protein
MRDEPGRGRKVTVTANADSRLRTLLATPPPSGRWTVRSLATAMGISRASVHRVLKASRLMLVSRSADEGGSDTSSLLSRVSRML